MDEISEYAKTFARHNANWHSDPRHRKYFLSAQEQWANDRLRNDGYLFLNDVYQMLGMKKTRSGQLLGWTRGEEIRFIVIEKPNGETTIDFSLPKDILDALDD
jgi:hypothetical protein